MTESISQCGRGGYGSSRGPHGEDGIGDGRHRRGRSRRAKALGKAGWRVLAHGRDRQRGAALVKEIEQAGGNASFLQADLASLAEVRRLAAEVRKATDRLELLINNAGIARPAKRGPAAERRRSHECASR